MNQTMNFEALGLACPKCRCHSAVVCAARNAHNAMALQCLQCEGTYFESDTAGRTVIGYVQKLRFYQPEGTRPEPQLQGKEATSAADLVAAQQRFRAAVEQLCHTLSPIKDPRIYDRTADALEMLMLPEGVAAKWHRSGDPVAPRTAHEDDRRFSTLTPDGISRRTLRCIRDRGLIIAGDLDTLQSAVECLITIALEERK